MLGEGLAAPRGGRANPEGRTFQLVSLMANETMAAVTRKPKAYGGSLVTDSIVFRIRPVMR